MASTMIILNNDLKSSAPKSKMPLNASTNTNNSNNINIGSTSMSSASSSEVENLKLKKLPDGKNVMNNQETSGNNFSSSYRRSQSALNRTAFYDQSNNDMLTQSERPQSTTSGPNQQQIVSDKNNFSGSIVTIINKNSLNSNIHDALNNPIMNNRSLPIIDQMNSQKSIKKRNDNIINHYQQQSQTNGTLNSNSNQQIYISTHQFKLKKSASSDLIERTNQLNDQINKYNMSQSVTNERILNNDIDQKSFDYNLQHLNRVKSCLASIPLVKNFSLKSATAETDTTSDLISLANHTDSDDSDDKNEMAKIENVAQKLNGNNSNHHSNTSSDASTISESLIPSSSSASSSASSSPSSSPSTLLDNSKIVSSPPSLMTTTTLVLMNTTNPKPIIQASDSNSDQQQSYEQNKLHLIIHNPKNFRFSSFISDLPIKENVIVEDSIDTINNNNNTNNNKQPNEHHDVDDFDEEYLDKETTKNTINNKSDFYIKRQTTNESLLPPKTSKTKKRVSFNDSLVQIHLIPNISSFLNVEKYTNINITRTTEVSTSEDENLVETLSTTLTTTIEDINSVNSLMNNIDLNNNSKKEEFYSDKELTKSSSNFIIENSKNSESTSSESVKNNLSNLHNILEPSEQNSIVNDNTSNFEGSEIEIESLSSTIDQNTSNQNSKVYQTNDSKTPENINHSFRNANSLDSNYKYASVSNPSILNNNLNYNAINNPALQSLQLRTTNNFANDNSQQSQNIKLQQHYSQLSIIGNSKGLPIGSNNKQSNRNGFNKKSNSQPQFLNKRSLTNLSPTNSSNHSTTPFMLYDANISNEDEFLSTKQIQTPNSNVINDNNNANYNGQGHYLRPFKPSSTTISSVNSNRGHQQYTQMPSSMSEFFSNNNSKPLRTTINSTSNDLINPQLKFISNLKKLKPASGNKNEQNQMPFDNQSNKNDSDFQNLNNETRNNLNRSSAKPPPPPQPQNTFIKNSNNNNVNNVHTKYIYLKPDESTTTSSSQNDNYSNYKINNGFNTRSHTIANINLNTDKNINRRDLKSEIKELVDNSNLNRLNDINTLNQLVTLKDINFYLKNNNPRSGKKIFSTNVLNNNINNNNSLSSNNMMNNSNNFIHVNQNRHYPMSNLKMNNNNNNSNSVANQYQQNHSQYQPAQLNGLRAQHNITKLNALINNETDTSKRSISALPLLRKQLSKKLNYESMSIGEKNNNAIFNNQSAQFSEIHESSNNTKVFNANSSNNINSSSNNNNINSSVPLTYKFLNSKMINNLSRAKSFLFNQSNSNSAIEKKHLSPRHSSIENKTSL